MHSASDMAFIDDSVSLLGMESLYLNSLMWHKGERHSYGAYIDLRLGAVGRWG